MTYNELALMLGAINPATEKLYKLDELNIFDFNTLGTWPCFSKCSRSNFLVFRFEIFFFFF